MWFVIFWGLWIIVGFSCGFFLGNGRACWVVIAPIALITLLLGEDSEDYQARDKLKRLWNYRQAKLEQDYQDVLKLIEYNPKPASPVQELKDELELDLLLEDFPQYDHLKSVRI